MALWTSSFRTPVAFSASLILGGCATIYRDVEAPGARSGPILVSVVDADIIDRMKAAEPKESATLRCTYWSEHPDANYWRAEKGTRAFVAASSEGWCKVVEEKKSDAKGDEDQAVKEREKAEQEKQAAAAKDDEERAAREKKEAEDAAKKKPGGKKK